ncbi:MAG: MFS transporter [Candidatus Lokiarchaeota archaeon]|nr:MFS transporter [Candidatus Lokiarchaeota archaeon]
MKKREMLSLVIFLMLILVIIMDSAILLPNQVLIAAELGVYFNSIGILIGTYTIIYGVSIIIFGYLTDKYLRKNLLILSGLLWSITALLYIFIEQFWQLMILRIIAAIATGITAPLSISYMADLISSSSRSKSFAFWGLITTITSLFASGLALAFNLIDFDAITQPTITEKIDFIRLNFPESLYTWKIPYFYLGITAFILTILNFFITIEPKRAVKEKYFEDLLLDENIQYSYRIKLSDLKYIYKRKSNFFLTMNFFDVVASGLLLAYIFPYIELDIGINIIDLKVIVLILVAVVFGLLIGQFGFAHWGDKKVQKGELNGRVKVATICSILTLPFLLIAFGMAPNVPSQTFFFGALHVADEIGFWVLWIIFSSFLGMGLALTMGIGPNWYASLLDVNFPENRGTMIAVGSFIDTIGRAMGAFIGGFIVSFTESFSATIFWSTLIFGILSVLLWIPLFFTSKKDFDAVNEEMKERSIYIKEKRI